MAWKHFNSLKLSQKVAHIHVGSAGVALGNAAWELYCVEHGLDFAGKLDPESKVKVDKSSATPFFTETSSGKHVPRSIFVDTDPSTIGEIRAGPYRQLFHPELLISGKEDASNVSHLHKRCRAPSYPMR